MSENAIVRNLFILYFLHNINVIKEIKKLAEIQIPKRTSSIAIGITIEIMTFQPRTKVKKITIDSKKIAILIFI